MEKILTIGIPTYNGASYIKETLESVLCQISSLIDDQVEILVSDNASIDETQSIINEYLLKYPRIINYRRNEINLGFDKNIDLLFKEANGSYVWLLGDDDALYNDSIKCVLNIINAHKNIGAIQANFDKYDTKLKTIIEKIEFPEDKYCQDAETFLYNSKGRWGAIASLIIKKDAWNSLDLTETFGTQTIFGYGLFKVILKADSYIVKNPLVKVRDGSQKAVAYGDGDARISIALTSGTLYKSMLKMGYRKSIIEWHLERDRQYAYDSIPLAKLWGIKNKTLIAKKLIAIHNSPILWIKWMPLIFSPDFIYKIMYNFRKIVSSKTKPIERKIKLLIKIKK